MLLSAARPAAPAVEQTRGRLPPQHAAQLCCSVLPQSRSAMAAGALDPRPDSVPAGAEAIELDVGRGITLRGRAWGPLDGEPWLLLHGWLDNCASFDQLCPLLVGESSMRLVCLDVAGHGHSSHRRGSSYTTADHVHDARMAALRLGWDCFSLLGHSMGGGIAATLAGTIPDKIKRLVLLEITGQGGVQPQSAPDDLARSLRGMADRHGLTPAAAVGATQSSAEQFKIAVSATRAPAISHAALPQERLLLYALYKQATSGPRAGTGAGRGGSDDDDAKARAKWKAWGEQKSKSKPAAAAEYASLVASLQERAAAAKARAKADRAARGDGGPPRVQYSTVVEAAAGRAKKNFGGSLPLPLAATLVSRSLRPVLRRQQPPGLVEGDGEQQQVKQVKQQRGPLLRLRSLSDVEATEEADQTEEVVLGFVWRSDPSLRLPLPGPRYSGEASRAFARRISCPVLVITARDGMYQTLFNPGKKFGTDVFSFSARLKIEAAWATAHAVTSFPGGGGAAVVGAGGLAVLAGLWRAGRLRAEGSVAWWVGGRPVVLCAGEFVFDWDLPM
jgi:pimeloyl-ACP methyl ester carboxylesterase